MRRASYSAIKDIIYLWFKEKHKNEKKSIYKHFGAFTQENPDMNISYGTFLKWIEVLSALGKLKMEDYGIIKVVWYEENG